MEKPSTGGFRVTLFEQIRKGPQTQARLSKNVQVYKRLVALLPICTKPEYIFLSLFLKEVHYSPYPQKLVLCSFSLNYSSPWASW